MTTNLTQHGSPGPSNRDARPGLRRTRTISVLLWAAVLITVLYAIWALSVAAQTFLTLLDPSPRGAGRAVPLVFVVHAATGAVCLAAGALQLRLLHRTVPMRRRLHRALGVTYVGASWATSLGGVIVTTDFEVGLPAKAAFVVQATLWFGATTLAYRYARRRRFARHGRWMLRSYALALFFITFSVVQPGMLATGVDRTTAYTLSILVSISINLAAIEWWIRRRAEAQPASRRLPSVRRGE
jgi:hypothetical protein